MPRAAEKPQHPPIEEMRAAARALVGEQLIDPDAVNEGGEPALVRDLAEGLIVGAPDPQGWRLLLALDDGIAAEVGRIDPAGLVHAPAVTLDDGTVVDPASGEILSEPEEESEADPSAEQLPVAAGEDEEPTGEEAMDALGVVFLAEVDHELLKSPWWRDQMLAHGLALAAAHRAKAVGLKLECVFKVSVK